MFLTCELHFHGHLNFGVDEGIVRITNDSNMKGHALIHSALKVSVFVSSALRFISNLRTLSQLFLSYLLISIGVKMLLSFTENTLQV
jgi:hypothetical protein